jgi:hypothetical protein
VLFDLPRHEISAFFISALSLAHPLVPFELLRRFAPIELPEKEYDVSIDFSSYRSDCAAAAIGAKAKKRVMWIHNDVEIKLQNEFKYRILWHFFHKKLDYYDEFCAVSPGIIPGFRRSPHRRQARHGHPQHVTRWRSSASRSPLRYFGWMSTGTISAPWGASATRRATTC